MLHICDKIRISSISRSFDFEMDPDRVTGVSTFLLGNSYCIAPEKATYPSLDPDAFDFIWISQYTKKPHAGQKIRILLALVCRKP